MLVFASRVFLLLSIKPNYCCRVKRHVVCSAQLWSNLSTNELLTEHRTSEHLLRNEISFNNNTGPPQQLEECSGSNISVHSQDKRITLLLMLRIMSRMVHIVFRYT